MAGGILGSMLETNVDVYPQGKIGTVSGVVMSPRHAVLFKRLPWLSLAAGIVAFLCTAAVHTGWEYYQGHVEALTVPALVQTMPFVATATVVSAITIGLLFAFLGRFLRRPSKLLWLLVFVAAAALGGLNIYLEIPIAFTVLTVATAFFSALVPVFFMTTAGIRR
jgi:hypothetical protein